MAIIEVSILTGLAALSVACIYTIVDFLLSTRRPQNFPPGPDTRLGFGNAHQLTLKKPYLRFAGWVKTYGSLIGLKVGTGNLVIVHDPEHMHELFSKRGAVYSGRRFGSIAVDHIMAENQERHMLNFQPGPVLRRFRAITTSTFGGPGQKHTLPMQEATSATLAHNLLNTTPEKTLEHLHYWALATPLLAITGQRLEDRGKEFSDRFSKAQKLWCQLLEPGNSPPVELFPFLRWVPEALATWKTKVKYVRGYMIEEYGLFLQTARRLQSVAGGEKGSGFQCIMKKILDDQEQGKLSGSKMSDDDVAFFGGSLLDAAVDTTWCTIMSLVLFMAAYPECQAKAAAEILRLSPDSPPKGDVSDEFNYLRAFFYEVLRMRPPAPSGLPHCLLRDDQFGDHVIPKGTTVVANIWSMHNDPDQYDKPDEFRPERFLEHPLGLKPGVEAPEGGRITYAFGSGHRVCPGDQFAQKSTLLAMAKLLWAYEIVPMEEMDTSMTTGYADGIVLMPNPYKVEFRLRDKAKERGVIADYEDSVSALRDLGL